MVNCLKCGQEYHVDVIEKEYVDADNRRRKERFYRVHCKKCGHILKRRRSDAEIGNLRARGIRIPDNLLTEEEFFEFQTRQTESSYIGEKATKKHAKRIFDKLKDSALSDAEKAIEKERMAKKRALNNLVRKSIQKLREATDLPEDEYDKLKEKVEEDIRKIRSGDFDPEELKKETEAVIAEIDKAEKREKGLKELEKETERKRKELEKEGEKASIIGHGKDYFKDEYRDDIKTSKGYDDAHWTKKRDAWMRFYEQEMENLRAEFGKGTLKPDEFRKNAKDLKRFVNEKMGLREKWSWRSSRMSKHHYASQMRSVVYLLAAVTIGVIVAATTGSYLFMIGFMGVALYLITPDPKNIRPKEGQKITWMTGLPIGPEARSKQNTAAFLRSLGKITAILFFALGFHSISDVFNILYIATAVIGYFLLKVEYDNSAEFIESLMRFFLGMILIPWIFNDIFGSLVLAGIAFAFFAVPPLPNEGNKELGESISRGLSGATAYYEAAQKFIFGGIMVIVLIASGSLGQLGGVATSGWELEGTLKYTFIYFWMVCGVAGFFSPAKERPVTGAIMLGAATVIYGIGPGSQAIGSGLLGQWWPTVHNTFSSITEPMANLMGSLGNTFSSGFLLLTNPVGYATQLMNGSYADNPGPGLTGAYGVDITSMTITPIFPEQPYVISAIVENKGAFDAESVVFGISALSPDKFGTEGTSRTHEWEATIKPWNILSRTQDYLDIDKLGFEHETNGGPCKAGNTEIYGQSTKECLQYYNDAYLDPKNTLEKLMVWQPSFQSDGIGCESIVGLSLRKKFIPITARLEYDYQSDSRVEVSFMSKAEWDRLAQAGDLETGFGFVESQYSSAPVKFPIGTAGLKNPILETQQFHISMLLDTAFTSNSEIVNVEKVSLSFPADWELKSCSPLVDEKNHHENKSTGIEYVEWNESLGGGGKTFYCYFDPLTKDTGQSLLAGAPTKSYIVTAHADYRFSRWKTMDTQIEFGGFCCPDSAEEITSKSCEAVPGGDSIWDKVWGTGECVSDDCLDSQRCINNACVSVGTGTNGGATDTNGGESDDFSSVEGYCGKRIQHQTSQNWQTIYGCHLGMGTCSNVSECLDKGASITESSLWVNPGTYVGVQDGMTCIEVYDDISTCCYASGTIDQCRTAFDEWVRQTISNPGLLQAPYSYPDEVSIHNVANINIV